jgi:hypothetical protein
LLAIRRVFVLLLFLLFFFYYLTQGLKHLESEAHYAAVLAPTLEVESFIIVVGEHFGEESLVVVKTLRPSWDGLVIYLMCLLTHLAYAPPLICLMCALCRLFQTPLPQTRLHADHIYLRLASATCSHKPEKMGHLADGLTTKGDYSLRAGPRFRRVSVGDVKAAPRRPRTRSTLYSAREGQASVELRDFESILIFYFTLI